MGFFFLGGFFSWYECFFVLFLLVVLGVFFGFFFWGGGCLGLVFVVVSPFLLL